MQRGLKILIGPQDVGKVLLAKEGVITCGRAPECELVLPGQKVSKKHCSFTVTASDFFVKDLKSSNGTYVNGVSVPEANLKAGDRVQVGEYLLEVVSGGNK